MAAKFSANPRFIQHPGKPNDYYMMMDGGNDMLEVYHTDTLLLGDNNEDYTISFAFLQTVLPEITHEYHALSIFNKGNWTMYR